MKKMMNLFFLLSLLIQGALISIDEISAAPPPQQNPPGQPQQGPGQKKIPPPPPARPPALQTPKNIFTRLSTVFSSPGIAALQGGEWVGTEHLYNLPVDIGLVVEIDKPGSLANVPVTDEKIKELISTSLKSIKLSQREPIITRQTPLPFLHALIIIHPIEKGYVVYCALRLFEEVQITRTYLKPGIVWQAITWEKQELIVTPADQLLEQVQQTFQSMMGTFTERIKGYALDKSLNKS